MSETSYAAPLPHASEDAPAAPRPHELRTRVVRTVAAVSLAAGAGALFGAVVGAETDTRGEYAGIPYQAHYDLFGPHEHYLGLGINNGVSIPNRQFPVGGVNVSIGMPETFDGLKNTDKPLQDATKDSLPVVASLVSYPESAGRAIADSMVGNILKGAGAGAGIGALSAAIYLYRRRAQGEQIPGLSKKSCAAFLAAGGLVVGAHSAVIGHNAPHYSNGVTIHDLDSTPFKGLQVHGIALEATVRNVIPAVKRVNNQINTFSETSSKSITDMLEATPLPEPTDDEVTVFHLSDIHNNLGLMKAYNTFMKKVEPDVIANTGDQAVGLDGLEAWAVDVFQDKAYEGIRAPRLFVAGNHDAAKTIAEAKKRGWIVLDPAHPYEHIGLTFIGDTDPRYDRFGHSTELRDGRTEDQAAEDLAKKACELADDNKPVIVLGHEPTMVRRALEAGCSNLGLAGHLHARNTEFIGGRLLSTEGTSGGNKQTLNLLLPQIDASSTLYYVDKETGSVTRYYDVTITPDGTASLTEKVLQDDVQSPIQSGPRPPYQ